MNEMVDFMGADEDSLKLKIKQQEDLINDLKLQLNEKEVIHDKTKEYLFIMENQIFEKDKEISALKSQNKKAIDENKLLKSTLSWKITKPLRKIKKII